MTTDRLASDILSRQGRDVDDKRFARGTAKQAKFLFALAERSNQVGERHGYLNDSYLVADGKWLAGTEVIGRWHASQQAGGTVLVVGSRQS